MSHDGNSKNHCSVSTSMRPMKFPPSLFLFSVNVYFSGITFGSLFNRGHDVIKRKSEYHTHIYSSVFFRISRTPGSNIPGFLVYLHSHCVGESGHGSHHQDQFKTPHDHVLFP